MGELHEAWSATNCATPWVVIVGSLFQGSFYIWNIKVLGIGCNCWLSLLRKFFNLEHQGLRHRLTSICVDEYHRCVILCNKS